MRLTELQPRWCGDIDSPPDVKQGVSFICPHCRDPNRRLAVFFANPVCGSPPANVDPVAWAQRGHLGDHHVGEILWQRSGDSFETLTLTPSIDCSRFGHWHGHITNGEVR